VGVRTAAVAGPALVLTIGVAVVLLVLRLLPDSVWWGAAPGRGLRCGIRHHLGGGVLRKRTTLLALACAVAMVTATMGAAMAGEVTGNGKPTAGPDNANSICVFSGKNDDSGAPLDGSGPNGPGGVSQSYGQENKLGLQDPHVFNPGDACRGGSNPARGR
jgi:hypothetical protein